MIAPGIASPARDGTPTGSSPANKDDDDDDVVDATVRAGALEDAAREALAACRRSRRARLLPEGGGGASERCRLVPRWMRGFLAEGAWLSFVSTTAAGSRTARVSKCAFHALRKGAPTAESMRTDHLRCQAQGIATPSEQWIYSEANHWESSVSAATAVIN